MGKKFSRPRRAAHTAKNRQGKTLALSLPVLRFSVSIMKGGGHAGRKRSEHPMLDVVQKVLHGVQCLLCAPFCAAHAFAVAEHGGAGGAEQHAHQYTRADAADRSVFHDSTLPLLWYYYYSLRKIYGY